jgi:hypothetical protein
MVGLLFSSKEGLNRATLARLLSKPDCGATQRVDAEAMMAATDVSVRQWLGEFQPLGAAVNAPQRHAAVGNGNPLRRRGESGQAAAGGNAAAASIKWRIVFIVPPPPSPPSSMAIAVCLDITRRWRGL